MKYLIAKYSKIHFSLSKFNYPNIITYADIIIKQNQLDTQTK